MRTWSDVDGADGLVDVLTADLVDRNDLPPSVSATVAAATRAFIVSDGCGEEAAREVGPVLMRLGRRAAVRGHSAAQLSRDLRRLLADRETTAEHLLARVRRADERDSIRRSLEQFFRQVHLAALRGHRQVCGLRALGEQECRERVVHALFVEVVPAELLVLVGLDPEAPLVPAVLVDPAESSAPGAVAATLPRGALAGGDGRSFLLPAGVSPRDGGVRWVIGPARSPADLLDALALTRQAAGAWRAGLVAPPAAAGLRAAGSVVTCAELADQLLLATRPSLGSVLAEKYLAGLLELRPARRVELAEVLLRWLETRSSLADIAADLHIARQTAFDRLRQGRALLGEAAETPEAHVAVVVALRASLPAWHAEAAEPSTVRRARAGARNRCHQDALALTPSHAGAEGDDDHSPTVRASTAPTPQEIR